MWRIIEGDARRALGEMPSGSVHTCVTSPPYFGLRDYGHDGQIGLEPTPDEFVAALVGVFREVRRVLRDDGTVWLNLGDSYCSTDKWGGGKSGNSGKHTTNGEDVPSWAVRARSPEIPGVKPKDLLGIPWMVAFALRADGWYLRSEIIWHKPNPMPESVTDRPTKAHEQVFLLSKSPRYFYDADAIREEAKDWGTRERSGPLYAGDGSAYPQGGTHGHKGLTDMQYADRGRNRRSVWTVPSAPYAGAHFATFPPKLIEPCILAGCPERCCSECGAPWERVVGRTAMVVRPTPKREAWHAEDDHARTQTGGTMLEAPTSRTVGFEPSCDHAAAPTPGTVLDPFAGAGTTGVVAARRARSFVGVELNPTYVALARDRIISDAPLLNTVSEVTGANG